MKALGGSIVAGMLVFAGLSGAPAAHAARQMQSPTTCSAGTVLPGAITTLVNLPLNSSGTPATGYVTINVGSAVVTISGDGSAVETPAFGCASGPFPATLFASSAGGPGIRYGTTAASFACQVDMNPPLYSGYLPPSLLVQADGSDELDATLLCKGINSLINIHSVLQSTYGIAGAGAVTTGPGSGTATPELQSDDLLALGLLPTVWFLWRGQRRRTT